MPRALTPQLPMRLHRFSGFALITFGVASCFVAQKAFALVKFNDGKDEIFITGTAGIGYDSNIFATSGGNGDTTLNSSLLLEYKRKAGMIGVNSTLGWDFGKFLDYTSEDFANPHARAELTKNSGRTTGSITMGAARETRADTAINLRTTSWDYDAGLNVKYPVIERYSLSGQLGYERKDFDSEFALYDLRTYTAAGDLFYVYRSDRDLFAGYRYRLTETTAGTDNHDHAFTVGISGKIIPKLNGTLRFGYQIREIEHPRLPRESYDSFTALASTTWTISKRLNVTGQLSRDFNTLATDVSVESTGAGLDVQYALNAKFTVFGGIGGGQTRFIERQSGGRHDTYFTANAGVAYTHSDRFKATLTYTYYQNWSTLRTSDYERNAISLNLSSRW